MHILFVSVQSYLLFCTFANKSVQIFLVTIKKVRFCILHYESCIVSCLNETVFGELVFDDCDVGEW